MIRRVRLLFAFSLAAAAAAVAAEPALVAPPDLAVDLVAREPDIVQPVFLNFDERGRMWVVLYRQYPEPAGLKLTSRDSVWRVNYDRPKPPPPYDTPETAAFRGRDRIVILEDERRDGSFAKLTTFADGLNITTAVCRGPGGVWVLSPPHLLWYPDADDDDVPDGPPVVALAGFGIEDTHSVANSLRYGPDGWLYGAVGSTVTCDIVRPGLDTAPVARIVGQAIWRYEPRLRRFEVFAEGGGNAFGCEIDAKGRVFSGHNGGDTRGFHYAQGAYLRKGFDKHGELSNPYAFGFFPAMVHGKVQRYSHNFLIYEGAALPPAYRGRLIAIDPMSNWLPLAEIAPRGATFATKDIGAVLRTEDRNFRPVDIKHGPDGALYVADWRDFQINHYRNHEGQITRDDGRIYRIRAQTAAPAFPAFDLRRQSSAQLVDLLRHENRWWRETALRLIGARRDVALIAPLRAELARRTPGQFALECLWALHLSGGFDEAAARELFRHPDPYVRLWAVRLVGDERTAEPATAAAMAALAAAETDPEVRSQLAATAKRLSAAAALPLVAAMFARAADADDPYIPLQLWWAVERACTDARDAVLAAFAAPAWRQPLPLRHVTARLMRRFAAAGTPADFAACLRLLEATADDAVQAELVRGFEQAFEGRALPVLPEPLVAALVRSGHASLALRLRQRDPAAVTAGLALLADPAAPAAERVRLIATFGEVPQPAAAAALVNLLRDKQPEVVRAALRAAAAYDEPALTAALVAGLPGWGTEERGIALAVLASRAAGAEALVAALEAGRLVPAAVPIEAQDKLRLVAGAALGARVEKLFGRPRAVVPAEAEAEIARVLAAIRTGTGNVYKGRAIYEQRCAACHRLFRTGGEIGPELTAFNRADVASLTLAIVSPAAEIREGYEPFVLTKRDGSVHTGFVAARDDRRVVLRDMAGLTVSVERADLASLKGLGTSLMPAGLLGGLSDAELRDFYAYLRLNQPLVGKDQP